MITTQMPIGDVKPYERNAKMHPEEQISKIAASIKEFGFNQPIVVDKNNIVIAGHGRLLAASMLGLETVPVTKVDLTPAQASAYRLADNKLNESEWDMPLVMEELKELELSGFNIELTGFSEPIKLGTQVPGEVNTEVLTKKKIECPHCGEEFIPE